MATEPPQTPSFRRLYLRPDSPLPDSPRFRRRLATIVPERYFAVYESRTSLGHFMESQFGIEVPHYEGMGGRVFKFEDHFLQAHIDDVLESITAIARYTRGAVRECFDAAENLFKLLTGTGQDLTQSNVTATLKPIVDRLHGGLAKATQSHAGRMLFSFADWANAGHP